MAQHEHQQMDIYTLEAISQAMTKTQIPSPAQIVADNICSANPVALCLFAQMEHPASTIMQALTQDDASLTTIAVTAATLTKLTAETK
jgi:histidinol dehydrogenase